MLIIGSHVSCSGKEMLLQSVKDTINNKANALQIFVGPPQNSRRKEPREMKIQEAHLLLKKHELELANVVVHAPYIINLATPEKDKATFAVSFLIAEIKRAFAVGASQIVLHPGNNTENDLDKSLQRIAYHLNQVLEATANHPIRIALETMPGKGNQVGKNFQELKQIIDLIDASFVHRMTVCLDTCHVHDAGYDLKNDYEAILKDFDDTLGLSLISVLHINDSQNVRGSKKDRHQNVGFGEIGFTTLLKIVHDERFKKIPKILETPYVNNRPVYAQEIAMLQTKTWDKNLKTNLDTDVGTNATRKD